MIRDINLTPSEELSLIIEYTSNESKKLAQRLRNAYMNKPTEGVKILWQKLSQRFGSDAVITEGHLNKLKDLPKIGFRDNKKLQELGDLLLQLQCAKNDGGFRGLRILDEPAYIKPVIAKLPIDIQTRWQKHAFRYKKQHAEMDYPPFSEFATFIQELSLERNDPNLIIDIPEKKNPGTRSPSWRREIDVKKTEIEAEDPRIRDDPPPRKSSSPDQWRYVATDLNPADLATRSVPARHLKDSTWLNGPEFLMDQSSPETDTTTFELAAEDIELRPEITTLATHANVVANRNLGTTRFLRFSRWSSLVNALSILILVAQRQYERHHQSKEPISNDPQTNSMSPPTVIDARRRAQILIVRNLQNESFSEELDCLEKKKGLPKTTPLLKLSPVIDPEGLLRVGGRLERADLTHEERHPLILPGKHHVTSLIVKHCHEEVKHQGRHFTHGMTRGKGFWIVGGKRLVNRVINQCLNCRRLRGKLQHQKMADLPSERLTPSPPFTYVGLDVFGPWEVTARRTRGGHANSKRWAVIFTCFSTRAIHIELVESMDTSSFINALRRFMAIRGHVEQIDSDCGTNFVGAHNEFEDSLNEMDQKSVESYLNSRGCKWVFNSPHASHTGCVWERMIGISRRILDSMFADLHSTRLTHEVLSTLMAEVTAIVNNRPLTAISSDPSAPELLTPSTLLTQKTLPLKPTPGNFVPQELYAKQWRQVQFLANRFWSRWKKEFLPTLQSRRKWETVQPNLKEGDLVLLRCKESPRNEWPLARISKAISSADGKVRKVEVTTAKNGSKQSYTRPVTEVILLKTEHELIS